MNLKKYLQQLSEKDAENLLTEDDKLFCKQLAESTVEEHAQAKAKKFKFKRAVSIAAAVLVAVVLCVALPIALHKNPVDEILYKEENIVQTACTIEEVNNDTKYFCFNEVENMEFRPQLNYDSASGDKLFYSINIWTEITEITLTIVVNNNYNFILKFGDDLVTKPLDKYTINYEVKKGIGTANYIGYINLNTEIVYINYTQLIDVGEQVFFEEIQSVLSVKN